MKKNLKIIFNLVLNIIFSITIVLLNKWIYRNIGFPNITLSMIHFLVTFLGLVICEKFDIFCIKDVAIKEMIPIAVSFCGFVVLSNLSLAHNTVGTYQVAKMLTTPCVIFLQILFYKKSFSLLVKLTLLPIIFGVIINFYYDIQFNITGTIYATLGVLITSLYQVWVNRKQMELQMDPMQLLYYQAPLSAALLLVLVPIVEPVQQTITHSWSYMDILMVLSSSVVSFFVNLTSYWIIGHTSPLTYNMVGHGKFCLLIIGGSIMFNESLEFNQAIGITLTLIGIVLYAHVKMKDNRIIIRESCNDEEKSFVHKI
ncbi:hypothetical protein HCN44_004554 [Aphidius gifuensis]|uniref:Sugar phosphate transporter domain-containing protein n=1 Tax=Aphidius gifuensis TaxID=684658 RepID=A0A834XZA9_APHGI|nr:solute carrier family 35 member E3-like [Aphidius gifuensis]KAF7995082.1 hypothetical protein HCN44_004554 [Aphidius gifuensis]